MQAGESQPMPDDAPAGDVTFACQECGKSIAFPDEFRGHVETCPDCGEYVDVPRRSAPRDPLPLSAAAQADSLSDAKAAARIGTGNAGLDPLSCCGFPATRQLWFEVIAVLFLAVIPFLFSAVVVAAGWAHWSHAFVYQRFSALVCDFQVVLPLLLILKLTKEPWARFGIVRFSWLLDLGTAVVIWLCALIAHDALRSILPRSLFAAAPVRDAIHWATQDGLLRFLLLSATCLCTAFAEELVMRGYLLTRLERLLRSTGLAILITAALFGSYHVYQGTIGLVGATAVGLVYGTAFCLQRRLWPVCIAHAMWNFIVMTHTS